MRREFLIAIASTLVLLRPAAAQAQAAAVPTFCDVTSSPREVKAGAQVAFTVTLKNVNDQPVPAPADATVTLSSNSFAKPVDVVVAKGQSAATTTVTMTSAGIGRVKAASAHWPAAFTTVLVRPANIMKLVLPDSVSSRDQLMRMEATVGSRDLQAMVPSPISTPAPAMRGGAGRSVIARGTIPPGALARMGAPAGAAPPMSSTPEPATPAAPPPPPPPVPSSTSLRLGLEINPTPVFPRAGVWKAGVTVMLLAEDGNLAIADRDIGLRLFSHVGELAPKVTTIRAGEMSTDATLTSSKGGDDLITVLSTVAHTSQNVQFGAPEIASLRIAPTPTEILNDGRAVVNVTVLLEAADHTPTVDSTRDILVNLDSDRGTLTDRIVTIRKGEASAETTLSSPRYGRATIKASSPNLTGMASVDFLFPWLMLALSIVGGAGGSMVREGFGRGRRRAGVPPFVRHLGMGALLGLVFFGLVMFGAVGSIPKMEVDVGKIIPLNPIGAFLLGFLGGALGNWYVTEDDSGRKKP